MSNIRKTAEWGANVCPVSNQLPKPYYDEDGITIYHGDCRELLPLIPGKDLLLCDPPWGVNHDCRNQVRQRGYRPYDVHAAAKDWLPCVGDSGPFDPTHLMHFQRSVIWGANHFADRLLPSSCWLCWDRKCNKAADSNITDCELAWTLGLPWRTVRMFRHMWAGFQRDSQAGDRHTHPMEKPIALMRWCIGLFNSVDHVCDPYCGTGATLVAAKLEGCRAIGIEIEEKYCEIAAKRLAQKVLF